eukprot:TRINITY_DN2023_c0_g1_i1.p1 TRINITY_DN2023_c0_g1~~TRINITY_DN2023_c0_g1_i1.p1  ORF type:complete len:362 (+),score=87.65 TRINITY_DN2023_c0_g1_i1:43-1128(+)
MDAVFIGNFVNDVIVITKDGRETSSVATGGSVTYGSLAASTYGVTPRVISIVGSDFPPEFLARLKDEHKIDVTSGIRTCDGKTTSYRLHYDEAGKRTLKLEEKGHEITIADVEGSIGTPDALFFVPVAAEFDDQFVLDAMTLLASRAKSSPPHASSSSHRTPVVGLDVQGFLRTFEGKRVLTRDREVMLHKLKVLGSVAASAGAFVILKTEHGEAEAILGPMDPASCAKELRTRFGFSIVSVTMGGLGGYLSSEATGEVYVPTFTPRTVTDETGCGDTFLAGLVLELLHQAQEAKCTIAGLSGDGVLYAAKMGSAAASFCVESLGPSGFQSRDRVAERVRDGTPTQEPARPSSVTVYKPRK